MERSRRSSRRHPTYHSTGTFCSDPGVLGEGDRCYVLFEHRESRLGGGGKRGGSEDWKSCLVRFFQKQKTEEVEVGVQQTPINKKKHTSLMSWSIQKMHPNTTCIFLKRFFFIISLSCLTTSALNLTLPHQYPDPEAVVQDVKWRVNASLSRRQTLSIEEKAQCLTGNPIDDCWRCDPNWAANRQKLADCVIGFARGTLGGKGGQIYVVTDSSDWDPANPTPGTLRHAVLQTEPLWIVFSGNMLIKLKHELIINSYKTIDGRGANIHITGNGCLTLQYVSHVIIHNIHIHHCKPSGNSMIASSPTHVGFRGKSDGDGISISGSQKIWIDHCALSYCTDGLVDAILGSTGITMSNSYFSHHNEVMLSGHNDKYPLGHRHAGPVGSVVALRTEKAAWCVLVRQLPTTTQAPFPVLRATTLPTTTQVAFSMFKQNITPNPFSKNTRITTKRTSTVVRWVTSEDLLDISIQNGCNYFL